MFYHMTIHSNEFLYQQPNEHNDVNYKSVAKNIHNYS